MISNKHNYSAIAQCPIETAACKGVQESSSTLFTSAPLSTSSFTTLYDPSKHAWCSGRNPAFLVVFELI